MISKCRLCGSKNPRLYYTEGNDDQFRYYKCPDCKLVNYDMSTGLDQEKHMKDFIDPRNPKHKANIKQKQTYNFIKRHIAKPGKLLDIGCNNGSLLLLAREDGWKVVGIELFSSLADSIKKATGIDVKVCDFLEYEVGEDESYDLVILKHVLEHLPDPVLAMNKIHALLENDGCALLEFPNTDSPDLRFKWFLRRNGIYRRKFSPDYVPHHCNEFCKESFEFLLAKTGFRLVKWQTYSSTELLSGLYNIVRYGNKARAVIKKAETAENG
jgi:2-polyprenyl-3-methyl-5-hydroxy-6-metoxy-1,4-benzoquinol methylase